MKSHGIRSLFADLSGSAADGRIRRPAVAGAFYPQDPVALSAMVDGYLSEAASATPPGGVLGLIAPHAGYVYSGGVAAYAYAALRGQEIERVVVLAPSHFESFSYASIYAGDGYATPLGVVPVDAAARALLAGSDSLIRVSSRGHEWSGGRGEHSLEVQLPFLQRVLGEFRLLPVVLGAADYSLCRALGRGLAQLARDEKTVLVASSDLSHYHPYEEARRLDAETLASVQACDYLTLPRHEACGAGPIAALLIAAEAAGFRQAQVLRYANSGDTGGGRDSVVGYGAVVLPRAGPAPEVTPPPLTEEERQALLNLARQSVEAAVRGAPEPPLDSAAPAQRAGVFVTLTCRGELRGCVGRILPELPLAEAVREMASSAACRDNRFPPVREEELPLLSVEISVLSRLRRVGRVDEIEIGRHGLLVRQGRRYGLLLPQVAQEHGLDRDGFLRACCRKAGLDPEAWRAAETDVFVFTASVFGSRSRTV
jgi:AmmeMemoRadiSam system protein B/AmmeMemoRadiSam system protein A